MGDHVLIGPGVTIGAMGGVVIEDHVRISESALIETASGNFKAELPYPHKSRPIHLGYGVSICAHAVVIGGVRIGAQAIVTAGSVVTKDVPANAIVRGNPAQIVGYRVRPPRHLRTLKAA